MISANPISLSSASISLGMNRLKNGSPASVANVRIAESKLQRDAVQSGQGLVVGHDDPRAWRASRDRGQCRADRLDRQVHGHADPREDGRGAEVEAGGRQPSPERLVLEVDRGVCEVRGWSHTHLGKALSLPRLCRGVIDLIHAQVADQI